MNYQHKKAIKVLKAWHRIEFFQTYSVPDKESSFITPVNVGEDELQCYGDALLPWLNPSTKPQVGLCIDKKTTYTLYLGLFDKAVLTEIVEKKGDLLASELTSKDELEQRLDSEGRSCFAKIILDEDGSPLMDTFSVSSLPWAIGKLLSNNLTDMSLAKFDEHNEKLAETISRMGSILPLSPFKPEKNVLDAKSIRQIINNLYQWAGVIPEDLGLNGKRPPFVFQMSFLQTERKLNNLIEHKTSPEKNREDDDSNEIENTQLPILNSFYIRDIERAINSITAGTAGKGLLRYLGKAGDRNVDLYNDKALKLIIKHLHPANTPEGRWPSDPNHNMSLMQQFAVNTAFKELQSDGIISVNGPPGTGKTTLLRDIIAQNIVERAKMLSALSYAGAGLTKEGILIESLAGFEMIVASSNNAAVENISKELPQIKSLADEYETCRYFQPVANQLSAGKKKGRLQPIDEHGEQAWGIITAVMGAKKKRDEFITRFFFDDNWDKNPPSERDAASNFLNIWQFERQYRGASFDDAKKQFAAAISNFESMNTALVDFENLRLSFDSEKYIAEIALITDEITILENYNLEVKIKKRNAELERNSLLSELSVEELALERVRLNEPGLIVRLLKPSYNRNYKQNLESKLRVVESLRRAINILDKTIVSIKYDLESNVAKYDYLIKKNNKCKAKWERFQNDYDLLQVKLEIDRVPNNKKNISDSELQRHAFWQNHKINDLRSKIFIAAMTLHEAWLMEALRIPSFRSQVFKIHQVVKGQLTSTSTLALWQILFMFVPVISTTFASLGRMFASIEPNSLGWLMIDEAGQAVPQAAIGGLMRAKRTIVVGDPLQIEPVFTSPPRLVEYLMTSLLGEEQKVWNPSLWSVQELADRVNPYGCTLKVMGKDKWVGIPLWVHRRCIDPMFSIANAIAYNNRMIHGSAEKINIPVKSHAGLGDNRWIETLGKSTKKQYKIELGIETLAILVEAAQRNNTIKDIYIITPFKAVSLELQSFIEQNGCELRKMLGWTKKVLSCFLRENVGTVHTFQGKENDTVILVLGCDEDKQGGAVWAASKPNLLNVAVTRAKSHLFVVGDSQVWSNKPYFDQAYLALSIKERTLKLKSIA